MILINKDVYGQRTVSQGSRCGWGGHQTLWGTPPRYSPPQCSSEAGADTSGGTRGSPQSPHTTCYLWHELYRTKRGTITEGASGTRSSCSMNTWNIWCIYCLTKIVRSALSETGSLVASICVWSSELLFWFIWEKQRKQLKMKRKLPCDTTEIRPN